MSALETPGGSFSYTLLDGRVVDAAFIGAKVEEIRMLSQGMSILGKTTLDSGYYAIEDASVLMVFLKAIDTIQKITDEIYFDGSTSKKGGAE